MHRLLPDHRRCGIGCGQGLSLSPELSKTGKLLWSAGPPIIRGLGRALCGLEVTHRVPLPDGPFVIAGNHFSHLDPPLVGAVISRPIRFLAVDELQDVSWLLDRTLATFGAIPLARSGVPLSALRSALARLDAGEIVGVFPEGTRVVTWGDRESKRGAAWLALRAGVPLVPVAVSGTDRVFGVDNRWHRGQIRVSIGPTLTGADAHALTTAWERWTSAELADLSHGVSNPG